MGENSPADFSPNRKKPSTPLRLGYGLKKKRKVAGGAVFSDLVKKGEKTPPYKGGGFSPNRQVSSSSSSSAAGRGEGRGGGLGCWCEVGFRSLRLQLGHLGQRVRGGRGAGFSPPPRLAPALA